MTTPPVAYRYVNMTRALDDKASPLRRYFDERFLSAKRLQAQYRSAAGALLVDGGTANSGTVGTAFDHLVRVLLDRSNVSDPPLLAAFPNDGLSEIVGKQATVLHLVRLAAEAPDPADDVPEIVLRACWALALCTEVYRAGLMPGSPLVDLVEGNRFSTENLLDLATDDAIRQLQALHEVSRHGLFRPLSPSLARMFRDLEVRSGRDVVAFAGG